MSEYNTLISALRSDPQLRESAETLISLNEGLPGHRGCKTVTCASIRCRSCPMTPAFSGSLRPGTYSTLGELRGAMDRIKRTEAVINEVTKAAETVGEVNMSTESKPTATSDVRQPSHYKLFQDVESIEVIARSMTVEQFHGFCFGNILKYRLRAGKKSELATMEKDLAKASFYETLFEQHKGKCHA